MADAPSMWEALAALQAEIPRIVKGDAAQVGTRPTRYASLERITDQIRPLLETHGFVWVCQPGVPGPEITDAKFVLHYRLIYAATGDEITGDYPLPSGTPQTMGGAITYARRYALCAVLNITPAEDDDDAEQATREAEDRQNARTRYVAEERASDPGPRTPADRGPMDDDPWATPAAAPEDEPGAVGRDNRLRARLHAAFGRAKITGRDDRLAYANRYRPADRQITSSNDLSERDALGLIAQLTADANEQEGNGKLWTTNVPQADASAACLSRC